MHFSYGSNRGVLHRPLLGSTQGETATVVRWHRVGYDLADKAQREAFKGTHLQWAA
jgi:hypothetical protein